LGTGGDWWGKPKESEVVGIMNPLAERRAPSRSCVWMASGITEVGIHRHVHGGTQEQRASSVRVLGPDSQSDWTGSGRWGRSSA